MSVFVAQADPTLSFSIVRTLAGLLIVLGIVTALAWLLRRGALRLPGRSRLPVSVEAATPLGDRRSLVIVSVEGRRLLLGLTPTHVALVTELSPVDGAFARAVDARVGDGR